MEGGQQHLRLDGLGEAGLTWGLIWGLVQLVHPLKGVWGMGGVSIGLLKPRGFLCLSVL